MALNTFSNLVRTVLDATGLAAGLGVGGTFAVAAGTGAGPTRQHTVFVENEEIVVTRAGDTYTIVARLAPVNHNGGATVLHDVSARDMQALMAMLKPVAVGEFLLPQNVVPPAVAASIPSEGTLTAVPFVVPQRMKIDAQAVACSVVGSAGAVIRMGLYADDGAGKPASAAPLVEATVAGTALGQLVAAYGAAVTLEPGLVWGAMVVQGAAVTRPTLLNAFAALPRQTALNGGLQGMYFVAAVAAALPAAPAWAPLAAAHSLQGLRVSALNT